MDLRTLEWDPELLELMRVPRAVLPEIRSSSEVYGTAVGGLAGVPVAGILGDQQASLLGHTCFEAGQMKNTYGTGAFLLQNVGAEPVISKHGLISTVAWKLGDHDPAYALEGSVAMAGALIQWLRDNLGVIADARGVEPLARSVEDSGGVVFVPAFSGLYAPYWRDDARGVIVGLTRFASKAHIARAALEATAYQTNDLVVAMLADTGEGRLRELRADGGMTRNQLLMQIQADVLGSPVGAPAVAEITATGAAYGGRPGDRLLVRPRRAPRQLRDHASLGTARGRTWARPRPSRLARRGGTHVRPGRRARVGGPIRRLASTTRSRGEPGVPMTRDVFLFLSAFLASGVEMVEALTIVLAVGVTRGWRSTLIGVAAAAAALALVVAVLGPAVSSLPFDALRIVVGALLLVFGLQWLPKRSCVRAGTWRCTAKRRRTSGSATTRGTR